MEWKYCVITEEQNTPAQGYGTPQEGEKLSPADEKERARLKMWAKFYGQKNFPTFEEAKKHPKKYIKTQDGSLFNVEVYKQRMRLAAQVHLMEAISRAQAENKQAYIHIVGLGTGVWARDKLLQEWLIIEVWGELLKEMRENQPDQFQFIDTVNFSWFNAHVLGSQEAEKIQKENPSRIQFSQRNPADVLENKPNVIVCPNIAWDGGSAPGNEYWGRKLSASGDPAAACCSTFGEISNAMINPNVYQNICICDMQHGVRFISTKTAAVDEKNKKSGRTSFNLINAGVVPSNNNLNDLPIQILKKILDCFPAPIRVLIALSGVNKSLNSTLKKEIFNFLLDENERKEMNASLEKVSMDRKAYATEPYSGNDAALLKRYFEEKSQLAVVAIRQHNKDPNKYFFETQVVDFGAYSTPKETEDYLAFREFLTKKNVKFTEDAMQGMGNDRKRIVFYGDTKDLSIFDESSIIEKKPKVQAHGVREAIGRVTACLLDERTNNIPFIEFTKDCRMILRFQDHRYARELSYALQKEGYIFNQDQSNRFNEFDIYPCEYEDRQGEKHQFITTSSIELNGVENIFRFVFNTCELDARYIQGFIFKDDDEKLILSLSEEQITTGFKGAFNGFINSKIQEFRGKLNDNSFFAFHNKAMIKKKKDFLDRLSAELAKVEGYQGINNMFDALKASESDLDGNTLKFYRHFKGIFSRIYLLNQNRHPGINQDKEKPKMQ
ncbi:MAG: DUF4804 domain-containing protein [Gammaproteobacteria bacterium]|nr:DUF4804 domain-containing protein [Gammaproteobacteria bacterium]